MKDSKKAISKLLFIVIVLVTSINDSSSVVLGNYLNEQLSTQSNYVSQLDDKTSFNDIYYSEAVYKKGINPPINIQNANEETISPATGNLEVTKTDISLKGINGLDFSLTRYYNLNESNLYDVYMGESYGTYYVDGVANTGWIPSLKYGEETEKDEHYNIATGWSFDLPYINENSSTFGTLYLGSAGAWPLRFRTFSSTISMYPVGIVTSGYPCTEMELLANCYEYYNGEAYSQYKLTFKDGKVFILITWGD